MNTKQIQIILTGLMVISLSTFIYGQLQPKNIELNAMLHAASQGQSVYTLQLTPINESTYKGVVTDAMQTLKVEGQYVERNGQIIEDGYYKYYFPNGSIESEGMYQAGVKVGNWKRFDFEGNRKTDRFYPYASANQRRSTLNTDISTNN